MLTFISLTLVLRFGEPAECWAPIECAQSSEQTRPYAVWLRPVRPFRGVARMKGDNDVASTTCGILANHFSTDDGCPSHG